MIKTIFQLALLIVLFQSCVVYNKTSVPLNQAENKGKVKVFAKNGQLYKYSNIVLHDSVYYGMGREYITQTTYISHVGAKTPLDSAKIESIFVKDTRKSKSRTVLFVLAGIPVTYLTIGLVAVIFFVVL